jgi:hypothetical protein
MRCCRKASAAVQITLAGAQSEFRGALAIVEAFGLAVLIIDPGRAIFSHDSSSFRKQSLWRSSRMMAASAVAARLS